MCVCVRVSCSACVCLGCASCARDAIERAHAHAAHCISALNTRKRSASASQQQQQHGSKRAAADPSAADVWGIGTEGLARVVAAHVQLLLRTDAAVSPTLGTVAAAQGCLQVCVFPLCLRAFSLCFYALLTVCLGDVCKLFELRLESEESRDVS